MARKRRRDDDAVNSGSASQRKFDDSNSSSSVIERNVQTLNNNGSNIGNDNGDISEPARKRKTYGIVATPQKQKKSKTLNSTQLQQQKPSAIVVPYSPDVQSNGNSSAARLSSTVRAAPQATVAEVNGRSSPISTINDEQAHHHSIMTREDQVNMVMMQHQQKQPTASASVGKREREDTNDIDSAVGVDKTDVSNSTNGEDGKDDESTNSFSTSSYSSACTSSAGNGALTTTEDRVHDREVSLQGTDSHSADNLTLFRARKRTLCGSIIHALLTFLIILSVTLLPLSVLYTQHHDHNLERIILSEKYQTQQELIATKLKDAQNQHAAYETKLQETSKQMKSIQKREQSLQNLLSLAYQDIQDLESSSGFITEELQDYKQQIESLHDHNKKEEEKNIDALDKAWERIHELTREKHDTSRELKLAQRTIDHLEQMKGSLSLDLERTLLKMNELEKGEVKLTQELSRTKEEKTKVTNENKGLSYELFTSVIQIHELQEEVSKNQEEHELIMKQLTYLEEIDDENQAFIMYLLETNAKMEQEIKSMNLQIEQQMQEAIAAVDAVAMAAATQKAEEMAQIASAVNEEIERLTIEAVNAATAVADAASARNLEIIAAKDAEMEEKIIGVVHAMNAVASTANEQGVEETWVLWKMLLEGRCWLEEGFSSAMSALSGTMSSSSLSAPSSLPSSPSPSLSIPKKKIAI